MYLLGIDIGSTTTKAVIYNYSGEIISIGRSETKVVFTKNEYGKEEAFWLPDVIWDNVALAVKEAIAAIKNPKAIAGVSVSGFGCDAVPVDKNGQWLYPFISWHDNKTSEQLNLFKALIDEKIVYKINGSRPWHLNTIFRNMWVKKYKPDIFKKTYKWLLITDYINYKLCGQMACDFSEASTTLVMDQKKLTWSEELFDIAEINVESYPELKKSGTILGNISPESSIKTGLDVGTPVVLGGHDNNCGAFAALSTNDDSLISITGTFESNICLSEKPVIKIDGLRKNLVCEKSVIEDKYILVGFEYAGGILEWAKKIFFNNSNNIAANSNTFYDLLRSLDKDTNIGSKGIFMLPNIIGSFCPNQDPLSLGMFIGLSEKAGVKDFLRAIIEGINYQSLAIFEALESTVERTYKRVINIGGAAYNPFWIQNKADISGKFIEVPDIHEATSLGAAMLAGIGAGIYKDFKDSTERISKQTTVYEPNMKNHEKYKYYYENIFKKLLNSSKNINSKINKEFNNLL